MSLWPRRVSVPPRAGAADFAAPRTPALASPTTVRTTASSATPVSPAMRRRRRPPFKTICLGFPRVNVAPLARYGTTVHTRRPHGVQKHVGSRQEHDSPAAVGRLSRDEIPLNQGSRLFDLRSSNRHILADSRASKRERRADRRASRRLEAPAVLSARASAS